MRSILVGLRFPADAPFDVRPISPDRMRRRAPHEVHKSETLNYRTMAPEPGGLFDPTLFGPGTVIDAPVPAGDELIRPRRTWFARVPLAAPMVHPLLVAHAANELAALVRKDGGPSGLTGDTLANTLAGDAGPALVAQLAVTQPWTIVREIAVLPPDLRPLKLDEHMRWALTPINLWYQRIIDRNTRLKREIDRATPTAQHQSEVAGIRTAMRSLFENDETSEPDLDPAGDPMPGLRTLAGGTDNLFAALEELAEQGSPPAPSTAKASESTGKASESAANASELELARHYIARAVLFAMGFELVAKSD